MSPDSGDEAHVSRGGAVTSDRDYLFIIHRSGIKMDMAVAADMRRWRRAGGIIILLLS